MRVEILNQGFNIDLDNSVGDKIIELLKNESIKNFTVLTAFTSESIISKLFLYLQTEKITIDKVRIVTGIDQKGTTKEALQSLLSFADIESRVFYSSTFNIFHPKIYLLEAEEKTYLIIGSSNLTQQGLFVNIESSIFLEIINNNAEEYNLILKLKEYYTIIESDEDSNIYVLSNELIEDFDAKKLLPTKLEVLHDLRKSASEKNVSKDIYKKRRVPKIPSFLKKIVAHIKSLSQSSEQLLNAPNNSTLDSVLWISSPLTERDLNVPRGHNTNITGDINIDKGAMPSDIDFRHYYREDAFNDLDWINSTRKGSEHLEEATGKFEIFVDNLSKGTYELKLSHNPKTDTKSYTQKNAMTKLKWGIAKDVIANSDYLGKIMTISKTNTQGLYKIEIK
ncbi:phospholipase D family protein [Chryseobacterium sp.]|uniref:phospholipase D family protein n=1 Tax=Chryseobacterium sp. TaxID=1871047 RepID=UPI0023F8D891|nr:phospholipase D family protein [Chryseobacterium sp.]